MKKIKNIDEAMLQLQAAVEKLELNKNSSLEDMVKNYEDGMIAYNFCVDEIDRIQEKINFIDKKGNNE